MFRPQSRWSCQINSKRPLSSQVPTKLWSNKSFVGLNDHLIKTFIEKTILKGNLFLELKAYVAIPKGERLETYVAIPFPGGWV